MSNEETYPGSASMRNKAAGDLPQGSGVIPNIRSNLFVLPLWRIGQATDSIVSSGYSPISQHIPWTGNFNNWGNPALDTDRNPSNGYLFIPGAPMPAATIGGHFYPAQTAAQTANQNLSRQDSANLALHMRLRGADSFHLLDSGLVDNPATPQNEAASRTDMEQDFATGWLGESSVNSIFAQGDKRMLISTESIPTAYYAGGQYSGGSVIWVDGAQKNVEQAGAIFSGAYSLTLGKLDVLISNMDDVSHKITLPATIGGYSLAVKDWNVPGGSSVLVEYGLSGSGKSKGWGTAVSHVPFTAIQNSRNGFGIPEPGTLSLLAVAGVFGLNRRKRQAQA
jgi:type II secretory pathway pseudopilin PulG